MLGAQVAATCLIYFTFQAAAPPFYSLVLLEIVICIFSSAFCYSYGPLAWLIPTGASLHHVISCCHMQSCSKEAVQPLSGVLLQLRPFTLGYTSMS